MKVPRKWLVPPVVFPVFLIVLIVVWGLVRALS
jgi:hypothetical protein